MEQDYKQIAIEFAEGIIETPDEFWDDPDGPHTYTCPFCSRKVYQGLGEFSENHLSGCLKIRAEEFLKSE